MKKSLIWKLLLFISLCPFIAPFFYYGILHIVHNQYSWTLFDLLILWSYVYWPTYIIGLIVFGISMYKLKKNK